MKFKASGTIQVFVTAEFEDDGTSIGDQAHRALMHEAMAQGMYGAEFINFEFDQVVNEGDNG